MTDFPHEQPNGLTHVSAQDWLVALATALLALLLLGILPRMFG